MQIANDKAIPAERPATTGKIKEWLDCVLPLWRSMIGIQLEPREKTITSCTGFEPGTHKPINEKIIRG